MSARSFQVTQIKTNHLPEGMAVQLSAEVVEVMIRGSAAELDRMTAEDITVVVDLTEAVLEEYLYSAGVPDPELIIRPSGELRISNFLLWQSAYSEFVYMNVLWPDFKEKDLDQAIEEYHRRNRRFGGV